MKWQVFALSVASNYQTHHTLRWQCSLIWCTFEKAAVTLLLYPC